MLNLAMLFHDSFIDSPFVVPVAGCAMILGISVAGIVSGIRQRQIQSEERLAAIAKGIPIPPTPEELAILHGKPSSNQTRRRANIRTAGIVLLATGAGLAAFFTLLAIVLQERNVYCGVAVALVPLAIGIGFLIDARIQAREIAEAQANSFSNSTELAR
jgi:voltage-gated potassium channel Kch